MKRSTIVIDHEGYRTEHVGVVGRWITTHPHAAIWIAFVAGAVVWALAAPLI